MTLTFAAQTVRLGQRWRTAAAVIATASIAGLLAAAPAGADVERDPAFTRGAPTGFVQDDFGTLAEATSVVALPNDGGVVAAGYGQDDVSKFIAVGRYGTNGTPDAAFGGSRKFTPTDTSRRENTVANDLVVDADGTVTVVGTIGDGGAERLVILRITRAGLLDTTFGDPAPFGGRKGYHTEPTSIRTTGRSILRRSDGYVVGGASTCTISGDPTHTCAMLQRYDANGTRQTSRLLDAGIDPDGGLYALTGSSTSNIVAAGQADSATGNRKVGATYIYDPTGTYISGSFRGTIDPNGDTTFRAITTDGAAHLASDARRGFIAVGTVGSQLLRKQFDDSGAPASTLPGGGEFRLSSPASTEGLAVARQSAGRTIVGGLNLGKPLLARTNDNGAGLDPSFTSVFASGAPGVIVETPFAQFASWRALSDPVVDGSGALTVYAAGSRTFAPLGAAFLLARYVLALPPQAYLSFPGAGPGNVFGLGDKPSVDYIGRRSNSGEQLLRTEVLWDGQSKVVVNGEANGTLALPEAPGTHTVTIVAVDADGLRTERAVTYRKDEVDPQADDDADGLLNGWELTGDLDGDGKKDLDLPAMGANYRHKDVFLRLDWMKGHALDATALKKVAAGFTAAPLQSPDGKPGVAVHLDHGPSSLMNPVTGATWGALSTAKEIAHVDQLGVLTDAVKDGKVVKDKKTGKPIEVYDWADAYKLRDANTTALMRKVFRYAISIHQYGGSASGGRANGIPGNMFLVARGRSGKAGCGDAKIVDCTVGTVDQQASTVMHELGHTLGLSHAGSGPLNYLPNYRSVMNYLFRDAGAKGDVANSLAFDYGRDTSATVGAVDEAALSESKGITASGSAKELPSFYICTGTASDAITANVKPLTFGKPVDWNCDGKIDDKNTVAGDVTTDGKQSKLELSGFDDWHRIGLGVATPAGSSDAIYGYADALLQEPSLAELHRLTQRRAKDKTLPQLKVLVGGGKLRAGKAFTLKPTASDERGVDQIQIWLDGQLLERTRPSGSPKALRRFAPRPSLTLPKGKHRVDVIVIDANGNLRGTSTLVTIR